MQISTYKSTQISAKIGYFLLRLHIWSTESQTAMSAWFSKYVTRPTEAE